MKPTTTLNSSRQIFLLAGSVICLLPFMNSAYALLLGLVGGVFIKGSEGVNVKKITNHLLKISIILMGFGMSWSRALESSTWGFLLTAISVVATVGLGILIGSAIRADKKTSLLIAVGTAICGGSAIAAVSPVINAKSEQMSFAFAVVFLLNSIALILFPLVGVGLGLDQPLFGRWAAIAIHDTSSVVGAGETFGSEALEIATITKLTRALWIIPMVLVLSLLEMKKGKGAGKVKIPWFILLFILAMVIAHLLPQWSNEFEFLKTVGKKGMFIVLFLIGSSINFKEMKLVGKKPFILGILLWILVSVISLIALSKVVG